MKNPRVLLSTFINFKAFSLISFVLLLFSRKQVKSFAFDHCFYSLDPGDIQFAGQEQVFQCLGHDILDNAFQGYNACIFAYGQTGTYYVFAITISTIA